MRAGLSQERLGWDAGLDEASASARMNRYERGTRAPDLELLERIGTVLDVPAPYFYATDDLTAKLLLAFHRLPTKALRAKALAAVEQMGKAA